MMKKSTTMFTTVTAAALLIALATTSMATTTYAQQSKACPEGFELNKGKCQAAPTIIPGECPDSLGTVDVISENNGICTTANTFPSTGFINACEEAGGTIEPSEDPGSVLIHCNAPAPDGERVCNTGSLNEQSGLCEIKPGNGRNV
jgi:hypothetical protein